MTQIVELNWGPIKADSNADAVKAFKAIGTERQAQKGFVKSYHGRVVNKPNSVSTATGMYTLPRASQSKVLTRSRRTSSLGHRG